MLPYVMSAAEINSPKLPAYKISQLRFSTQKIYERTSLLYSSICTYGNAQAAPIPTALNPNLHTLSRKPDRICGLYSDVLNPTRQGCKALARAARSARGAKPKEKRSELCLVCNPDGLEPRPTGPTRPIPKHPATMGILGPRA